MFGGRDLADMSAESMRAPPGELPDNAEMADERADSIRSVLENRHLCLRCLLSLPKRESGQQSFLDLIRRMPNACLAEENAAHGAACHKHVTPCHAAGPVGTNSHSVYDKLSEPEKVAVDAQLVNDFIAELRKAKLQRLAELERQIGLIDEDLAALGHERTKDKGNHCQSLSVGKLSLMQTNIDTLEEIYFTTRAMLSVDEQSLESRAQYLSERLPDQIRTVHVQVQQRQPQQMQQHQHPHPHPSLLAMGSPATGCKEPSDLAGSSSQGLETFARRLMKFTRYTQVRHLGTPRYSPDYCDELRIICAMEFDIDYELLAAAGATEEIKLFSSASIVKQGVSYPVHKFKCYSQISDLSWSKGYKHLLATGDSDGGVIVWDAGEGRKLRGFGEHRARCWSVDFNHLSFDTLASASTDREVKVWSFNQPASVAGITLPTKVGAVCFDPTSVYHLAIGTADGYIRYHDLRNGRQPLRYFKQHDASVSRLSFLNGDELLSASPDNRLRLTRLSDVAAGTRSYAGHANKCHVVGLAAADDYFACGSEDNSVVVYHRDLATPLHSWTFPDGVEKGFRNTKFGVVRTENCDDFVSAVCWLPETAIFVAANSLGYMQAFEMMH